MKTLSVALASIFIMLQANAQDPCCEEYSEAWPLVSIEYLYWEVQEDGLYPAILPEGPMESEIKENNLRLRNQKFEYTSGFRVALGYNCDCMKYDVSLAWTRIHPSTTAHFSVPEDEVLFAISFFDQTDSDVAKANSLVSRWHLDFDMLDLVLGRKYTIGERFKLRPNIGVKGGWIDQLQKIETDDLLLGQPPDEIVQATAHRRNNFKGIGPRVGVDLKYGFGSHFEVISTISGALLYGNFSLENQMFLSDTSKSGMPGQGPETTTLGNSDSRLVPTAQILLGADWVTCFDSCSDQTYWFRLGAAYEVQYWWDQMRSISSIPQLLLANTPSNGDLTMHGLTVQASLNF